MLEMEELKIERYYDNSSMPYGMSIMHIPSLTIVKGNCRTEQAQENLQRQLMEALEIQLSKGGVSVKKTPAAEQENQILRDQLDAMQAQIDRLMNGPTFKLEDVPSLESIEKQALKPKAKGWPKGKPRKAKVETPMGELSEKELLAQAMRPPTDAPMHIPHLKSRGGLVTKGE